ncbi:MAG: amidohydrolase [Desulfobacteraceae bacterium]|nr:amidohydrolase [Desulfobacteraceae bacterium]
MTIEMERMDTLRTTLIQTELHWEDIAANLDMFDEKIENYASESHLIVLPEMFSTGFTMNAEALAEGMNGSAVTWLRNKAASRKCHITGSVIIREQECYFNRLIWATPEGGLHQYDKRHLFRYAGEEKVYHAGDQHLTIELNGWKIRPFICYDLRFPLWTRNFDNSYDVAIFIANWPEKRASHWKALLKARAIENQSYVIAVNRIGEDGNGFYYSGDSVIIDPTGKNLFHAAHTPCIHTAHLPYEHVAACRNTFPVWKDADRELVK